MTPEELCGIIDHETLLAEITKAIHEARLQAVEATLELCFEWHNGIGTEQMIADIMAQLEVA